MSLADFKEALAPELVRTTRIVHFALAGGIAAFTAVLIYLYSSGQPGHGGNEGLVAVLSLFAAVSFPLAFVSGRIIADRRLSTLRNKSMSDPAGANAAAWVSVIRTTMILRCALIEGAAYFGLAVLTLSITDGVVYSEPVYLANFAYPVLALVYFARTVPTEERFEEVYVTSVAGAA